MTKDLLVLEIKEDHYAIGWRSSFVSSYHNKLWDENYQLLYVIEGAGSILIDGIKYDLTHNYAAVIVPYYEPITSKDLAAKMNMSIRTTFLKSNIK